MLKKTKDKINKIFNIIGAAAVIKNFPFEFKMAERNDAMDIKNKKGIVILLRSTARSNFPSISLKPGEIRNKNSGVNISITKTIKRIKIINKFNTWFAK